jgi:hypothetical protein
MGAWAGQVGSAAIYEKAHVLETHSASGTADNDPERLAASLLLIGLSLLAAAPSSSKSAEGFNVVSRQLNDVVQYPLAEIALMSEPDLFLGLG